jgi:hypothetical protein
MESESQCSGEHKRNQGHGSGRLIAGVTVGIRERIGAGQVYRRDYSLTDVVIDKRSYR